MQQLLCQTEIVVLIVFSSKRLGHLRSEREIEREGREPSTKRKRLLVHWFVPVCVWWASPTHKVLTVLSPMGTKDKGLNVHGAPYLS